MSDPFPATLPPPPPSALEKEKENPKVIVNIFFFDIGATILEHQNILWYTVYIFYSPISSCCRVEDHVRVCGKERQAKQCSVASEVQPKCQHRAYHCQIFTLLSNI